MDYNSKYKSSEIEELLDKVASGGGGGGGSSAYSEVSHGTSDTTFTLTPNTFHIWDEVSSLTLTLDDETAGVANEFLFQFNSGSTATTLTLPDSLKWANDSAPTIEANKIYQISVLKGLGSVLEFNNDNASLIEFSIGSEQYQADRDMSWNDWVSSEYNTNNYYIGGGIVRKDSFYRVIYPNVYTGIQSSEIIREGYEYELYFDD